MEIKKIKIEDIIPYSGNAKEHPQEQIEQIKNSIKEFGNNDPIAIDESNVIIEGHGRYIALKELGYEETDCIVLFGLTEEQKSAYRIVHNQLTMSSGFDEEMLKEELKKISFDMTEFGLTEEMLADLEGRKEIEDDDFDIKEALDQIEEPITKLGDIWKLGRHYLMCGDSRDKNSVLKLMQENKVDLFLTDPPYNVDYEGSDGQTIENDDMKDTEFYELLLGAFKNANDVLKDGASFYIWHADKKAFSFWEAFKSVGWQVRQCVIWVKNALVMGMQDYQQKHEPCFYGWKKGASHHWYSGRSETTILNFDKPKHNDLHPTMKPLDLFGYLVQNSSKKNDIVLDLFGGSGTSICVCEKLDRTCYTMELDPKYCDVIIKRWELLTEEKVELIFTMPKVGDKIKIIHMTGEEGYEGKTGVVEMIDDLGQLHGTWGDCAIIPLIDKFELWEK